MLETLRDEKRNGCQVVLTSGKCRQMVVTTRYPQDYRRAGQQFESWNIIYRRSSDHPGFTPSSCGDGASPQGTASGGCDVGCIDASS